MADDELMRKLESIDRATLTPSETLQAQLRAIIEEYVRDQNQKVLVCPACGHEFKAGQAKL